MSTLTTPHTRRRGLIVLLATAALLITGCGDDEGDEAAATEEVAETSTSTSTTAPDADSDADSGFNGYGSPDAADRADPDGGADDYCAAALAFDQSLGLIEDFTPDELATVEPLLDDLVAVAPDEIAADLAVEAETLAAAIDGDFSLFASSEFTEANDAVHAYDIDTCGFTEVPIVEVDYAFEGDPPTEAGIYSFEVSNQGQEPHELLLARVEDEVDGTAQEAFAAVTEETFDASFDTVFDLFVDAGDADYQYADLATGRYVMFCTIPVGTTDEEHPGDGPPHFVQGMVAYFEIA